MWRDNVTQVVTKVCDNVTQVLTKVSDNIKQVVTKVSDYVTQVVTKVSDIVTKVVTKVIVIFSCVTIIVLNFECDTLIMPAILRHGYPSTNSLMVGEVGIVQFEADSFPTIGLVMIEVVDAIATISCWPVNNLLEVLAF